MAEAKKEESTVVRVKKKKMMSFLNRDINMERKSTCFFMAFFAIIIFVFLIYMVDRIIFEFSVDHIVPEKVEYIKKSINDNSSKSGL